MLLIKGRSSLTRRCASSASSRSRSSPSASNCARMSAVSSVKNNMRPENLMEADFLLTLSAVIGKPFLKLDGNLRGNYNLVRPKHLTEAVLTDSLDHVYGLTM